jgi:hypothetical protein
MLEPVLAYDECDIKFFYSQQKTNASLTLVTNVMPQGQNIQLSCVSPKLKAHGIWAFV